MGKSGGRGVGGGYDSGMSTRIIACTLLLAVSSARAQPAKEPPSWNDRESPLLTGHLRLTDPDEFLKAGEAYFNADATRVIFQAIPHPPEGRDPDEHYSMYVADLRWVRRGNRARPVALDNIQRLSEPGSANTCGWFHPTDGSLLFGSTLTPPDADEVPGYQRGSGTYKWAFPTEMEIVTLRAPGDTPAVLFEAPGYTAEGSYDLTGRFVLYAQVDDAKSRELGRPDADLHVFDTQTATSTPLVVAEGYDGGPFFNADATWITYRSDRRGDNQLQLFAAELERDEGGAIARIAREVQLTDNTHVNWAPFFHPANNTIVYTTSQMGHFNYELFSVPFDPAWPEGDREPSRVTEAPGFDGLAVFTADGQWMMWTSQRGLTPDEPTTSSQLWIARFNDPRHPDRRHGPRRDAEDQPRPRLRQRPPQADPN